jgi:hypothetical protein
MSPEEHDLSQRVLEFLIAQQDYFMLDVATPPANELPGSAGSGISDDDDVLADDSGHSPVGGAWKLVKNEGSVGRPLMERRKTTTGASPVH